MEEIRFSRVFDELSELKDNFIQITGIKTFISRDIHTKSFYKNFEKKYLFREKIEDCEAIEGSRYYLKSKIYESILYVVTYKDYNYYYDIRVILTDEKNRLLLCCE